MSDPTLAERAGNGSMPPAAPPAAAAAGAPTGPTGGPGIPAPVWPADDAERGVTAIAEDVVVRIVTLAAHEVDGVARLGGPVPEALASMVPRLSTGGGAGAGVVSGVGVEVGTRQVACDLALTVRYPSPVREVAEAVREQVIDRLEAMTGLEVVEVNIAVVDLAFEDAPVTSRVQ